MNVYDDYLSLKPTHLGLNLQLKRIQAEWNLIAKYRFDIHSLIEIGPGYGVFANWARHLGIEYYGLEANFHITQELKKSGHNACQVIAPPIPVATSSVDMVYAAHVVEHLSSPQEVFVFMKEIRRVLLPGGLVAIVCPDFSTLGSLFWDIDYTHSFPVTERRLQQVMSDADLKVLKSAFFSGPFQGNLRSFLMSRILQMVPVSNLPIPKISKTRLDRLRFSFFRNILVIACKS